MLGHPTELTGTTNGWGILKGKVDGDEYLASAALREFKEESNIDLTVPPYSYGMVYAHRPFFKFDVGNKKTVYVFWFLDTAGTVFKANLSCPSLVTGTDKPEIDKYLWVTSEEAQVLVADSQKELFEQVAKLTAIK